METYTEFVCVCGCVCAVCLVRAEVADAVGGLFGEKGGFLTVTFYFDLRPVATGERQTFAPL